MLNKKRPYGIVSGVPGVGFEQDGRLFKPNGDPVIDRKPVHDPPSTIMARLSSTDENDDAAKAKDQKQIEKVDYKKHDRRRGQRKQGR